MYLSENHFALGQAEIFPPGIEDPDGPFCWLGYIYGGAYSRWHCVGYRLAERYRSRLLELAHFIRTTDPRAYGHTRAEQENWIQSRLLMIWQNVKMWLDRYARDLIDAGVWGTTSERVMAAKREGEEAVRRAWRERYPEEPLPAPPRGDQPPRPEPLPPPPKKRSLLDQAAESIRDALRIPAELSTIKTLLLLTAVVASVFLLMYLSGSRPGGGPTRGSGGGLPKRRG